MLRATGLFSDNGAKAETISGTGCHDGEINEMVYFWGLSCQQLNRKDGNENGKRFILQYME